MEEKERLFSELKRKVVDFEERNEEVACLKDYIADIHDIYDALLICKNVHKINSKKKEENIKRISQELQDKAEAISSCESQLSVLQENKTFVQKELQESEDLLSNLKQMVVEMNEEFSNCYARLDAEQDVSFRYLTESNKKDSDICTA